MSASLGRQLARRNVDRRIKVVYRSGTGLVTTLTRLCNISLGGAFIRLDRPRLSSLHLELVFPESVDNIIYLHKVTARIVRVAPSGVALQFRDYDNRFYYYLLNLVSGQESTGK